MNELSSFHPLPIKMYDRAAWRGCVLHIIQLLLKTIEALMPRICGPNVFRNMFWKVVVENTYGIFGVTFYDLWALTLLRSPHFKARTLLKSFSWKWVSLQNRQGNQSLTPSNSVPLGVEQLSGPQWIKLHFRCSLPCHLLCCQRSRCQITRHFLRMTISRTVTWGFAHFGAHWFISIALYKSSMCLLIFICRIDIYVLWYIRHLHYSYYILYTFTFIYNSVKCVTNVIRTITSWTVEILRQTSMTRRRKQPRPSLLECSLVLAGVPLHRYVYYICICVCVRMRYLYIYILCLCV